MLSPEGLFCYHTMNWGKFSIILSLSFLFADMHRKLLASTYYIVVILPSTLPFKMNENNYE